jgi:serine/threonine protein kinase
MAPEIVGRKDYYGMQADVWALGIMFYAMLCGKMPFKAFNDRDLYRRIEKGTYTLPNNIQEDIKGMISKMLAVNPKRRPTLKALIDDEWAAATSLRASKNNFSARTGPESTSLDLEIISGIVKYI